MPSNTDRQQQNWETTDLFTIIPPTALRDSDIESKQRNASARGIVLIVKLSAEAGIAGFTPRILIKDEAGNSIIYWSAAAELTANGTATYVLYPGAMAGAGAGVTANASIVLPREWILQLDYTTGTPATDSFTVAAYGYYLL